MSRRTLTIVGTILLLLILILAIWLAVREDSQEKNQASEAEMVKLSQLTSGWRLIEHPVYGVSLEIPSAWEITILENGKGKIEAAFVGAGVSAVVNVVKENNVSGLTPDELLVRSKDNQVAEVNQNSVKGIIYKTKVGSEHETGFISDSYLLLGQYFPGDQILSISCSLSGPNYKTMIPTCEEIMKSLQFIQ